MVACFSVFDDFILTIDTKEKAAEKSLRSGHVTAKVLSRTEMLMRDRFAPATPKETKTPAKTPSHSFLRPDAVVSPTKTASIFAPVPKTTSVTSKALSFLTEPEPVQDFPVIELHQAPRNRIPSLLLSEHSKEDKDTVHRHVSKPVAPKLSEYRQVVASLITMLPYGKTVLARTTMRKINVDFQHVPILVFAMNSIYF
jgi:hypothetical protein